jgi:hypothetical protein
MPQSILKLSNSVESEVTLALGVHWHHHWPIRSTYRCRFLKPQRQLLGTITALHTTTQLRSSQPCIVTTITCCAVGVSPRPSRSRNASHLHMDKHR